MLEKGREEATGKIGWKEKKKKGGNLGCDGGRREGRKARKGEI